MLARNFRAAVIDDRVVLLDLKADRYRLLRGAEARVVAMLADGQLVEDVATYAELERAGIIEANPGSSSLEVQRPPTNGFVINEGQRALSLAETGWVLWASRRRLRRIGFANTLKRAKEYKQSRPVGPNESAATSVAKCFETRRRLLPFHRACLPDSLALFESLTSRNIQSGLVIGVRLDPFLAHCWVQTDQVPLNDHNEVTREYTTIFSL